MTNRDRRRVKIRAKIFGTKICPRFSVYRSNQGIIAQLVDDQNGRTLAYADGKKVTGKDKMEIAKKIGAEIAKQAKTKKITKVKFDRGGFSYHGRVAAVANSARENGLKF